MTEKRAMKANALDPLMVTRPLAESIFDTLDELKQISVDLDRSAMSFAQARRRLDETIDELEATLHEEATFQAGGT